MIAFLNHLLSMIPDVNAPILATAAVVIELMLRFIPSQKPLGILHMVGGAFNLVGAIFMKVGALFDKVLPQNIKPQA
jgi:hypothetical protein